MSYYFGLKNSDFEYIVKLLDNTKEVEQASIFGSRAAGNYRKGSDVDIAIIGKKINFSIAAHLNFVLEEESPMPYFFDIVNYTGLKNKNLRSMIKRSGKIIYKRNNKRYKTIFSS